MTWPEKRLGDIAHLNIGRTPPRKNPAYWTDDLAYPFLSIAEMSSRIADPVNDAVTRLAIDDGKAKVVPAGSLLMSFKLTIGKIAFAARDMCTNEAIVWLDVHDDDVLTEYLAVALEVADLTAGQSVAVKGATLNKKSMAEIKVAVPPLEVQRRVVDLIDHIDTTISAAQALAATAAAAADPLWADKTSSRPLVEMSDRASLHRSRMAVKDMPTKVVHYSIPVLDERDEPAVEASNTIRSGKFAVTDDSVLLSLLNPRIQRVWVAQGGEGVVCSTEFAVLRPKAENGSLSDLYWTVRSAAFKHRLESVVVGTTGSRQRVKPRQLMTVPVPASGQGAAEVLDSVAEVSHRAESTADSLSGLRDAILDDLLAGNARLADGYDRFLDEVAA